MFWLKRQKREREREEKKERQIVDYNWVQVASQHQVDKPIGDSHCVCVCMHTKECACVWYLII